MNYEPLHHKYRPQTFADLVGQEAIAATLTNAITSKRIAPAYLFTGSRGTGKTSSARILAKSLNCLAFNEPTPNPCGKCDVCRGITNGVAMDVIEIDAASNTGVDNIREIIEKSHFAPVQCRYKVYAIDEVHGLTNQAFNALLKTLEEPPERVVFILATTDPQRVLPTIISRCQRFDFRRIPLESMVKHLLWIAKQEQIQITEEAVRLVAQISQGGLRDAESLLDQLSLLKDGVTAEKVWDLVGAVSEIDLLAMVQAIAEEDPETIINRARNLMDRGKEPMIVLQNLAGFYRDLLIAKTAPKSQSLVALTPNTWQHLTQEAQRWTSAKILAGSKYLRDSETQIKHTTQPRLWLEVTLLGLLLPDQSGVMPMITAAPQALQPANSQASIYHNPSNGSTNTSTNGHSSILEPLESASVAIPAQSNPQSPQPEANPQVTTVTPELITEEPEIDEMLETWQEVVENIAMYSTQVFLKQHCQLLTFDGMAALIGVTNENLISTARRKQGEIETAFSKLCSRKVVVTLEVAGKKGINKDISRDVKTSSPSVQENGNSSYSNGNGNSNGANPPTSNDSSHSLNSDRGNHNYDYGNRSASDRNSPAASSNGNGNSSSNIKEFSPSPNPTYATNGNRTSHNGHGNNGYASNGNGSNGNGSNGNNGQASELVRGSGATMVATTATIAQPSPNNQDFSVPTALLEIKPEPPLDNNLGSEVLSENNSDQDMSNAAANAATEELAALKQISSFFEGDIVTLDGVF